MLLYLSYGVKCFWSHCIAGSCPFVDIDNRYLGLFVFFQYPIFLFVKFDNLPFESL